MKGLRLFFAVVCAALLSVSFVSCSDDGTESPTPEEKQPGVTVTAGAAAETALSFTITPENAEQCAWICIKSEEGGGIPTAEEILASAGTQVSVSEATTVEVTDLTPETEYIIVAAAGNGKTAVLSEQITMTTLEKGVIGFNEAIAGVFTGNATVTFTEPSETYQLSLDFYYDSASKWLPAGTYPIGQNNYAAGTVDNDPSYTYFWLRQENKVLSVSEGMVTVELDENHVYSIAAEFVTEEGKFKTAFTGKIEGIEFSFDFTATEAKRLEAKDETAGEYYLQLTDGKLGCELTLDLFADAESATLPEGTYTVSTDTKPGSVGPQSNIVIPEPYNSQEQFAAGTVEVKKEGEVYTLDIKLVNAEGFEINGTFTGEIADMVRKPKLTEIAMTAADAANYGASAGVRNIGLSFNDGKNMLVLDVYYDDKEAYMPEGTYTIGDGDDAGMVCNSSVDDTYMTFNDKDLALKSGAMTVAIVNENQYDITVDFSTDEGDFKVTYTGEIKGMTIRPKVTEIAMLGAETYIYGGGDTKNASLKFYKGDDKLELDLYYDGSKTQYMPAGTYTICSGYTAGVIDNSGDTYTYFFYNGKKLAITGGTMTVAIANKQYDVTVEFSTADGDFKVTYKGDIDGFALSFNFTASSAKRLQPANEVPGQYNIQLNGTSPSCELTLDLYADADSTTLPEGTYTVSTGTAPGSVGPASLINIYGSTRTTLQFATGTVTVTKADDVYTLDIKLAAADGFEITGTYSGKITNMERGGGGSGSDDMIEIIPDKAPDALGTDSNPMLKFYSGETTLSLDIYTSGGWLTPGTYTIGAGSSAGMIDNSYLSYCSLWYEGQRYKLNSGTMTVAKEGDIYDIYIEFSTDAGNFKLSFKGSLGR